MKINKMTPIKTLRLWAFAAVLLTSGLSGCKDIDLQREDTPELITKVVLTFTSDAGLPVVVAATDPDAQGIENIQVDGAVKLQAGKAYTLSIDLFNELAHPGDPAYDIGAEVLEQAHEHMFFFEWTPNLFSDPTGNGNMDARGDAVNYEDRDDHGLPVGLTTSWTAGAASSGTLRVVLKHQPDLKSATSGSAAGETDLDVVFDLIIQ